MVAAAVVAGAVGSAAIGAVASSSAASTQANAAEQAAQTQAGAADRASQTQLQMFHEAQQTLSPYVTTGNNALSQLASLYGVGGSNTSGTPDATAMMKALANFPGYQFAFNQGTQALDRSASSRGLLLSGGQLKDLTTFGQGMASQQFGNYVNQLQALGSLGESAAAMTGNAAVTSGQGIAGSQLASGNALAQGILGAGQAGAAGLVGASNAASGAIQGGVSNYILGNYLSGNNPGVPNNASSFTGFNSGNAQTGGVLAGGVPLQGNIPVGTGPGGY